MDDKHLRQKEQFHTDFLVIGSGLAGLYAALYASKFGKVAILTKSTLEESNSYWAQGGIAAAVDPEDSPLFHLEDTIKAGRGLCNDEAVEILVREGKDRVEDLISLGMKFDSSEKGFELGLEGGHTKRRVLHAGGSSTGKEMVQFLITSVKANPSISIFENTTVARFISDGKRCFGALVFKENLYEQTAFISKSNVLAAGGASGIYVRTTNPPGAVGEGIALAYGAGAEVTDMEFIQFHPTALYIEGKESFLISEAARGEGAFLLNHSGRRFMLDYHELAELAPRDVVSRAIFNEMKKSGEQCVFLSLKHLDSDFVKKRFSNIFGVCSKYGIDITRDSVPVSPAAHYTIGGVKTGLMAETNLRGLFACGEVAWTGVHGANRLASNSLLECIVFSKRAIDGAIESDGEVYKTDNSVEAATDLALSSSSQNELFFELKTTTSRLMTEHAGIVRNKKGLAKAVRELEKISECVKELSGYYRLKLLNIIEVSSLIVKAALLREESRGAHVREDFPEEDPEWKAHIIWKKNSKKPLVVRV
jgi:L-aspartate oxidase